MKAIRNPKAAASALLLAAGLIPAMCQTSLQAAMPQTIPLAQVLKETAPQANTANITLTSGNAGSLEGRAFKVYRLFDVSVGSGEAIRYDFLNDGSKTAIQQVVASRTKVSNPETITAAKAVEYMNSISAPQKDGYEPETGAYRTFIEELRNAFVANKVEPTRTVQADKGSLNSEGDLVIQGLPKGYYVIDEVSTSLGANQGASLCLANTITENTEIRLKGVYPTVEKKIHEDDNNIGWNDIADFEIGQNVPYRYESSVPAIGAYKTYTFNFHDEMDKALTLKTDTIKIEVKGFDEKGAPKTITLVKGTDYTLEGPTASADGKTNTFALKIADLKAILDKNFQVAPGEVNVYGQHVTVSYDAELNENAVKKTGRPGFENKVRLEYSNNPDSDGTGDTGFTPWDTVVCFTYALEGTKINGSESPETLAGAHFRLYTDQACTNEVLLKKTGKDYRVVSADKAQAEGITNGDEIITEEDGKMTIYGLDQGIYYLKETQAPEGYHGPLTPIKLTITPTFTQERNKYTAGEGATDMILKDLTGTVEYEEYYDGSSHKVDQILHTMDDKLGGLEFSVINRPGKKLPLTGSNTALISLGGGSVVVIGGLLAGRKKKKQQDQ